MRVTFGRHEVAGPGDSYLLILCIGLGTEHRWTCTWLFSTLRMEEGIMDTSPLRTAFRMSGQPASIHNRKWEDGCQERCLFADLMVLIYEVS